MKVWNILEHFYAEHFVPQVFRLFRELEEFK